MTHAEDAGVGRNTRTHAEHAEDGGVGRNTRMHAEGAEDAEVWRNARIHAEDTEDAEEAGVRSKSFREPVAFTINSCIFV
jgi:hypothetical protein